MICNLLFKQYRIVFFQEEDKIYFSSYKLTCSIEDSDVICLNLLTLISFDQTLRNFSLILLQDFKDLHS